MSTALLVIEDQESFRARPENWRTASAPAIADRIQPLVEAARTAGHHVVWVLHTEPANRQHLRPGARPGAADRGAEGPGRRARLAQDQPQRVHGDGHGPAPDR